MSREREETTRDHRRGSGRGQALFLSAMTFFAAGCGKETSKNPPIPVDAAALSVLSTSRSHRGNISHSLPSLSEALETMKKSEDITEAIQSLGERGRQVEIKGDISIVRSGERVHVTIQKIGKFELPLYHYNLQVRGENGALFPLRVISIEHMLRKPENSFFDPITSTLIPLLERTNSMIGGVLYRDTNGEPVLVALWNGIILDAGAAER